jgi:hypothetical protein
MLLVTAAALLVLVPRYVVAWAVLATAGSLVASVFALRGGLHVPLAGPLFTLWIAASYVAFQAWRSRTPRTFRPPNIPHDA